MIIVLLLQYTDSLCAVLLLWASSLSSSSQGSPELHGLAFCHDGGGKSEQKLQRHEEILPQGELNPAGPDDCTEHQRRWCWDVIQFNSTQYSHLSSTMVSLLVVVLEGLGGWGKIWGAVIRVERYTLDCSPVLHRQTNKQAFTPYKYLVLVPSGSVRYHVRGCSVETVCSVCQHQDGKRRGSSLRPGGFLWEEQRTGQ